KQISILLPPRPGRVGGRGRERRAGVVRASEGTTVRSGFSPLPRRLRPTDVLHQPPHVRGVDAGDGRLLPPDPADGLLDAGTAAGELADEARPAAGELLHPFVRRIGAAVH